MAPARLAAPEEAVALRRRDRLSGTHQPRTFRFAARDPVAQLEFEPFAAAEVARRGDAGARHLHRRVAPCAAARVDLSALVCDSGSRRSGSSTMCTCASISPGNAVTPCMSRLVAPLADLGGGADRSDPAVFDPNRVRAVEVGIGNTVPDA